MVNVKLLKNNLYMLGLLFKASPKRVITAMLSSISDYGIGTLTSLFLLRFIIEALENQVDFSVVVVFLLGYTVLCISGNVIYAWYNNKVVPETKVIIQQYLMGKIYEQALSADLSCYENPKFYDTYTKANEELMARSENLINNLRWITGILFSAIMTAVAIMAYEPFLLVLVIVPVIIEQFFSRKYNKYKHKRYQETTFERRKMEYVKRVVYLQDFAKDLRLSNIFRPIKNSFHAAAKDMQETYSKYGRLIGIFRFFRTFMAELVIYLAAQGFIVYQFLYNHAYSLGELTTLLNAVINLTDLMGSISWALSDFYENGIFIDNFKVFLEYETKMPENEDGEIPRIGEHDLVMKNVSFTYEGAKEPVLKNINLSIKAGERIALVGHNGAGKSTFVKLLMRLYDVTTGEILMDGVNVKDYRLSKYHEQFGTIFQDFKIFASSVTENILLYSPQGKEDEEKAIEALKKVGIYKKIAKLPDGMNTQLTKEFSEDGLLMSGGEFQKLAIARVFAKESSIAILDEPSSALDPISEYEVFDNMMKACEGKTVIFVSHRLSSAILADRIYMLENGEIIEEGSHKELMERGGKYAEMFQMQAKRYREEAAYEN